MHLLKRLAAASLIVTAVALLTACPSQTTISKINADPARYRNKEVAIVGTVRDSYGVLGNGAYEIDDGTGRLWVVTRAFRRVGHAWAPRAASTQASTLADGISAQCWKNPIGEQKTNRYSKTARGR